MEVVFWITLAVACLLCGYGIYAAVRKGRSGGAFHAQWRSCSAMRGTRAVSRGRARGAPRRAPRGCVLV